jgi:menaquinone-9 beta-reductase
MYSCDVLIAGGGPAGSSCAWGLRSSGLHVVILDKCVFPRDKICGGWVTPLVLQELEIDPASYARGRTFQPITGFRVSSMGEREVDVAYDRIVSYGIRRCEFDEYLLRRSGAQIREGVPIGSVERSGDSWIVNGEIRTRLLVGAGGHFCPVARFLGNANAAQAVVAQEVEFAMDAQQAASCNIAPEVPELYFCRDLQGYGWSFRKGDFLNIGLGRLDQHGLADHVSRFLEFLRAAGKLAFDPGKRLAGHAYLLFGHSRRKLMDDSVMLIGDSAGLAYALSGEGIRPAVESGLLAAKVIRLAGGRYTRDHLERYPRLLADRFSRGRTRAETLARYLPRSPRNRVARLLLNQEWFCRRVVVDNWFLHARDPKLLANSSPVPALP